VVDNLVNNACKYTPSGGRVRVGVECPGGIAVVRVGDSGVGLPRHMLNRVFELFVQVDQSRDKAQGGLGIGLTLVRRLVELHGGTVTAHSDGVGRGSEFVVRLPLAPAGAVPLPATAGPAVTAAYRVRVLVVDDNRDTAESMASMLDILGGEIRTAFDGRQALDAVQSFQPDLVFLDIGMPGMSGLDVARRIRQERVTDPVLLAALTGWGQEEDRRQSQAAGFDWHLVKPIDMTTLQEVLAAVTARVNQADSFPKPVS
jgi:CheY-like chemotaxis protein